MRMGNTILVAAVIARATTAACGAKHPIKGSIERKVRSQLNHPRTKIILLLALYIILR